MPGQILGTLKQKLFAQLQKSPVNDALQLKKLLDTYQDLAAEELQPYVSAVVYEELLILIRNPKETEAWTKVEKYPSITTIDDLKEKIRLVSDYIRQFPAGYKINEANTLMNELQTRLRQMETASREQSDWDSLDRDNYSALSRYHQKYPDSAHNDEIEDLMWQKTCQLANLANFNRYVADWPDGKYVSQAYDAIDKMNEWDEIKRSKDILRIKEYMDRDKDNPFINEVRSVYYTVRDDEMKRMKKTPTKIELSYVEDLLNKGIFTLWDLIDEGLTTEEMWESVKNIDPERLPDISQFQVENPNISAPEDCTDVYLFGTPGTGKTCLLMGLAGANGNGYTLNMKINGGPYASALQQYVNAGFTPGRTYGKYVTTINGQIDSIYDNGKTASHKINLVEMSGEEFAFRVAENQEVSFDSMGTGVTNLLKNDNRKVFLIVVDCSGDQIEADYKEEVVDEQGIVVAERIRKRYLSQLDILNKFVSLFMLPENQKIMQKVDAIHFVVTKADMLGDIVQRKASARELLMSAYRGPVEMLKRYCQQSKRINMMTDFRPKAYTFSLGKFFLGDLFRFDNAETLQIIDSLRGMTMARKDKSWFDRFKAWLR